MTRYRFLKLSSVCILVLLLHSCVATKAVTTPLRVVGAATSVIPVVGTVVDKALDTTADVIDDIPV